MTHNHRQNLTLVRGNGPESEWALYPPETDPTAIAGKRIPPMLRGHARWSYSRQAYDSPTGNDYLSARAKLQAGWPPDDWKPPVEPEEE